MHFSVANELFPIFLLANWWIFSVALFEGALVNVNCIFYINLSWRKPTHMRKTSHWGQKIYHVESNNINNSISIDGRKPGERNETFMALTLSQRIRMGCVRIRFRYEMRNFNLTTFLYLWADLPAFASTDAVAVWINVQSNEKCAPKILIKFIYINAVQLFCIVVWYASRGGRGGGGWERNGCNNNIIFPIAWKSQYHWIQISLKSPKWLRNSN